ncbi:MAG: YitT family protein [Clostridia bacterium]|nr:YitT family protein [Clostridia bacterium]
MKIKKEGIRYAVTKISVWVGGSILYGLSVNMFIAPGGITMGGFTGIATTLNHLFHTPVGLMTVLLNLPLLLIEIRTGGGSIGLFNALLGVLGTSLATDLLSALSYPNYDPLLSAVFGGLTMGAGTGILLSKGFTTGGSDLSAHIIHRRFSFISTGKLILAIDAAIVITCALLLQAGGGILFSFVSLWCFSTALDYVLDGFGGSKLVLIISGHHDLIADRIMERLHRGVTAVDCEGRYTKKKNKMLFCAVRKSELFALTELVRRTDKDAFLTICDARDVLGNGFRKM